MPTPITRRAHPGFAAVETLMAAAVLSVAAVAFLRQSAVMARRATESVEHSTALRLAQSTAARIQAAGPVLYRDSLERFLLTPDGRPTADWSRAYQATVRRLVVCAGGVAADEVPAALMAYGCGSILPTLGYRITVQTPDGRDSVSVTGPRFSPQALLTGTAAPVEVAGRPQPIGPVLPPLVPDSTPVALVPLPPIQPPVEPPAEPPSALPTVSLTASRDTVVVGDTVAYQATYTPGSAALVMRELVADGQSSPTGQLRMAYAAPGTYTATAGVLDALGRSAMAHVRVVVRAAGAMPVCSVRIVERRVTCAPGSPAPQCMILGPCPGGPGPTGEPRLGAMAYRVRYLESCTVGGVTQTRDLGWGTVEDYSRCGLEPPPSWR